MDYQEFLDKKSQIGGMHGFDPVFMPDFLFDFQKHLVEWICRKGRGAIFADTGLGKTGMQLSFAQNIVEKTNGNVLILTPLAVSHQTMREAEKFDIECKRSRDGKPKGKITVTNYQQIEKFNPSEFAGCVCDESSAIKNATGSTKKSVTRFMSKMKYRGLFTATPSPNDFVELGTSSEALGELKYMEMISTFFRDTSNDKNPQWSTPKYELKKHAVNDFWRWVASWARAIKKPSDIGFSDDMHRLPPLNVVEHVLKCTEPFPGELFVRKAKTLTDQRRERRQTLYQRVERVSELVSNYPISIIWAHYNYETDFMEKEIPEAVQISGSDSDERKEEKFIAFGDGEIKNLIIKPQIGAWGMNWQHCNHMTTFMSHSYEQYYQGVRRCWRFGQKKPVHVDIITTEGEMGVYKNIERKARDADIMFSRLVKFMNDELNINPKQYINTKFNKPNFI